MAIRSGLLGAILFAVAGCASTGNEVLKNHDAAAVNTMIVDNKTTREEVLAIYGTPTVSSFLNEKNEMWTYRWARATAQGQNFIPVVGAFVRGYDTRKKELVIVFNEHNIVARHTMVDTTNTVKSGLIDPGAPSSPPSGVSTPPSSSSGASTSSPKHNAVASASSTAAAAPAGGVQQAAVTRAPVRAAGSLPAPGVWECGVRNGKRHFTLQIVVGASGSMTVTTYANAPATIVSKDPLTFTAVNPRGDRTMTIVWNTDNTLVISGLNSNASGSTFRNEGACAKM